MAVNQMVFETPCRECDREITKKLPATHGTIERGRKGIRVRCEECRTTNFAKQVDTL